MKILKMLERHEILRRNSESSAMLSTKSIKDSTISITDKSKQIFKQYLSRKLQVSS